MSNYLKRLPLMRRSAQVADPGEMVDLRMEDASWRQGFRALSEPSTAETGEVIIWGCTEDEYNEARWEERRAVGMTWPATRMRVSPSPHPWRLSYRYGQPMGRVRLNKEGREP
jgi:hypothetical protein